MQGALRSEGAPTPVVAAMTQPPLCYPHPKGLGLRRPPASGLHETAGLPGTFALDFMAPGGAPFLPAQGAAVTRLSGHRPALGARDCGTFGWSLFLTTAPGKAV